jgi:hypothetical protein
MPLIIDGMQPLTRARARAIKDSKTLKKIPSQEGKRLFKVEEGPMRERPVRARLCGALSHGRVAWH